MTHVYRFENDFLMGTRHWRDTPVRALRRLARRVAADHHRAAPVVVANSLWRPGGDWASYNEGGRIALARHHRNPVVLLHELAHWIQGDRGKPHGPAFLRTYFSLLVRYLRVDEDQLRFQATIVGVKL